MIIKVEEYMCSSIPEYQDIEKALHIAQKNNVVVRLTWEVFSNTYSRNIYPYSGVEEVLKTITKTYPI